MSDVTPSDPFVVLDSDHEVSDVDLVTEAVSNEDTGPMEDTEPAEDTGPAEDRGPAEDTVSAEVAGPESGDVEAPPVFVPLEFVSVEMVLPSTNPVLILREQAAPHRELHIAIGVPEGVAIAYAARHVVTPRPLTHELFTHVLEAYNLTLEAVRITRVERSAYEAELVLSGAYGMRVLPCRVSDGVCLAMRQRLGVPVTAAAEVLDLAAFDSTAP